jgi:hypothetical protein
MNLRFFLPLLFVATVLARGPQPSNLPITTNFANTDASGVSADIQSDGLGAYHDGVGAVTSFLTTNGYNGIVWGDWQFGTLDSTTRKVSIDFLNPISVDSGGTATPIPPFTIKNVIAHVEVKCTQLGYSMILMSALQSIQCPLIVHFFDSDSSEFRIYAGPNWESETTFARVACNTTDSDGCNDWSIDPIPAAIDGSGNTIPGMAIGRLVFFGCSACPKNRGGGKVTGDGNRGDYYFKFHFHLMRP